MLELSGVTDRYCNNVRIIINKYCKSVNWIIEKRTTIDYFKNVRSNFSQAYYRKQLCQIRKFLRFFKVTWADEIKLPPMPRYAPTRVTNEDIEQGLSYFSHSLQFKALINLGKDSGMRPEELYQLKTENIDLENRIVFINHNPSKGQTTKTKESRVSFFTEHTKLILEEYFSYFNNGCELKKLWGKSHTERAFRKSPIQVRLLRKYFSQEWERRNGNHNVKEKLMGHSLAKNVDARHYSFLSEGELRDIYDKVMD